MGEKLDTYEKVGLSIIILIQVVIACIVIAILGVTWVMVTGCG